MQKEEEEKYSDTNYSNEQEEEEKYNDTNYSNEEEEGEKYSDTNYQAKEEKQKEKYKNTKKNTSQQKLNQKLKMIKNNYYANEEEEQKYSDTTQDTSQQKLNQKLKMVQRQKFVSLLNTGNLCYLNSTMQVIFSMPYFCGQVIKFFESKKKNELNATALSFLKKLKEKKAIDEGRNQKYIDLSELRESFNYDLEKRHRDSDNTFGHGQNDSSEFYIFLFEFLIKYGKDQDLKKKESLLGIVRKCPDNPPTLVEKAISRKSYNFGSFDKLFQEYFIKESAIEEVELQDQLSKLQKSLEGLSNPVEEYFFNGSLLSDLGPCEQCKYNSLTISDFSFFELAFYGSRKRKSVVQIETMLKDYFKNESVNARCKNPVCDKYPVNIMKDKRYKTLYHKMYKSYYLIKLPKMLKLLFKRYNCSGNSQSKISGNVDIPIFLNKSIFKPFYYKQGSVKISKSHDKMLEAIACKNAEHNYYLFAYSLQSGSLNSGHYITKALQYFMEDGKIHYYYVILDDSVVSLPQYGGKADNNVSIMCEAYWAMFVREDQEDFQQQLRHNRPPEDMKGWKNQQLRHNRPPEDMKGRKNKKKMCFL